MTFPAGLHFLEDSLAGAPAASPASVGIWEGTSAAASAAAYRAFEADPMPFHPLPYVNDYSPEPSYTMWESFSRRGTRVCELFVYTAQEKDAEPSCPDDSKAWREVWGPHIDKAQYLESYAAVQSELRPRVPLCLPAAGTYLVLHLRRGDRWGGNRQEVELTEAVLRLSLDSIRRSRDTDDDSGGIVGRLPWLVLSDDDATRSAVLADLGRLGFSEEPWTCDLQERWPDGRSWRVEPTLQMAQSFFAMYFAAGVLVSAAGSPESSFSTVAALAGRVPLLLPVSLQQAGAVHDWVMKGNGGEPMRDLYLMDGFDAWKQAVSLRHQAGNSSGRALSRRDRLRTGS
mmetsp:Transcript_7691/g.28170  ORF Transcript_7691/g.28170 Transcript_7691/m.28170 type:complete len:343 (+) Transcript_7691:369-1397(+)